MAYGQSVPSCDPLINLLIFSLIYFNSCNSSLYDIIVSLVLFFVIPSNYILFMNRLVALSLTIVYYYGIGSYLTVMHDLVELFYLQN